MLSLARPAERSTSAGSYRGSASRAQPFRCGDPEILLVVAQRGQIQFGRPVITDQGQRRRHLSWRSSDEEAGITPNTFSRSLIPIW